MLIGMHNKDYRPTLPQLRAFVAIAETGHFGQAAARLGISQPSLSQALSTMEQGLGVQLVERSTRRVLITPLGRGLIPIARQISELVEDIVAKASGQEDSLTGEVSIGFIPTVAPYILPNFLRQVRDTLPELKPRIVEEPTTHLVDALKSGDIDAAVIALPAHGENLTSIPLYFEEFYAVLPEGHPHAGADELPLDALADLDMLLLDDGHCLRDQVVDLCRSVDTEKQPGENASLETRAASLATVVQCVAGGLGETLIPESALHVETAHSGLVVKRFEGPTRPGRTIGLIHRNSTVRGGEFDELGKIVKHAYEAAIEARNG